MRAEQHLVATDPFERHETRVGGVFITDRVAAEDWASLFAVGDEFFEAEFDRLGGSGQGQVMPSLPARPQRIHIGERGGLDASSCRACHFVGGPDGAGSITQVALFRGDGHRLETATVRDAPHVMGLGYISRVARDMESHLQRIRAETIRFAVDFGEPVEAQLVWEGMSFGRITALPDGSVDTSQVEYVAEDLIVRPFGHKGRHATLVDLADEALQIHLGLQTNNRIERYADDAETYLGPGSPFDPDDDGVQSEGAAAQSVLLAGYLSMLGVPQIRPPNDPVLSIPWARGRALMDTFECTECHRVFLPFRSYELPVESAADPSLNYVLPLDEAGQDPVPTQLDFGPIGDEPIVEGGIKIFAFTDLRRHDMGPELAEPVAEVLPDGSGAVPGSVWLTRSLWGLADTAPYLHDGRAPTIDSAIRWHGGEGRAARDAYVEAAPDDQAALRLFLSSLTRAPVVLVE